MTTHAHLKEKFPALDHSLKRRSVFCAKEKGACYRLEHLGEFESVDYQVDGVLISGDIEGQPKCDRLLLVKISEEQWIHVFIELKGKNVSHGLEQLEATLAHPLFTPRAQGEKRLARLVAKSVPSSKNNPLIERVRKNLLQRYRCSLRILKPNQPEDFEDLRRSS
jgi:hypothetical protein